MFIKKIRDRFARPQVPEILGGCAMTSARPLDDARSLVNEIEAIGPWFHNYEIASGVYTNASGGGPGVDYPARRWKLVEPLLPDVRGKRCLDVGCSSGFFSLKLKEMGAAYVLGIDCGEQLKAMNQARFAAARLGLDVEFQAMSVYDVATLGQSFDLVLFMGVFYHLRHPLLALEALRAVSSGDIILQTITTWSEEQGTNAVDASITADVPFGSKPIGDERFPAMQFIEGSLNHDASCWFVPNPAAVLAMLRSCGFAPQQPVFPSPSEIIVRAHAV